MYAYARDVAGGVNSEEAARPKPASVITASGACPSSDTTWAAMSSLVPRGALDALPRSAAVDVTDLGDSYRVRLVANGIERIRVYRDVARDCEQRARFAAVFVVLTLMPPELLIDSPPKLPPPEPVVSAGAPEPPALRIVAEPPARRLRLELAAMGDTAPAVLSGPDMTSPGGELRAAVGGGRLVALFAVGLQPRSDFSLGPLRAREQRVPIDVGLRLRRAARWIEVGGEAGLAAALFRSQGLSPVVAKQATRIDLGTRAGVTLRVGARDARIAPIAGLHATYFPRPYEIATTPAGVVGRTPALRLGATLGISATF
jgi:hypothetical protein